MTSRWMRDYGDEAIGDAGVGCCLVVALFLAAVVGILILAWWHPWS